MEQNQTNTFARQAQELQWSATDSEPGSPDGHSLCFENRYPVGRYSAGNGLRLGDECLETPPEMAKTWYWGKAPQDISQQTWQGGAYRPEKVLDRCSQCARSQRGPQTGPNPTDRAKTGTKRHLVTDAQGIPVAVRLSSANTHDVKEEALATVEAIPAIQGPKGRPRKRPVSLRGDKGYDSADFSEKLRKRNIQPKIDRRRRSNHHLGNDRWLIEGPFSWLNRFRRLRIHYERRSDIHEAFLHLGCALICANVSLCWFC